MTSSESFLPMHSSTSALGIPTRGCSIWKGPRWTVFSLFYKNIIGPFDKSCFALPFRSWRKQRNISSEICMSIVVSRLALVVGWSLGVRGRVVTAKVSCVGILAVLAVIDLFSIIFVELVFQNVGEHCLESAKGSRIPMVHIHVKRSPGAVYLLPWGGLVILLRGGRVHFQVLIGFGGHFQIRVFWWVSLLFMKVEQGSDGQELKLNVTSVNSKHQSYLHNCREGMWSTSEPSLACRRYFFLFFRQEIFWEGKCLTWKMPKINTCLQTT